MECNYDLLAEALRVRERDRELSTFGAWSRDDDDKNPGFLTSSANQIVVDYYRNGIIGVHGSPYKHTTDAGRSPALPNCMKWQAYVGPRKEYVSVTNSSGDTKYWLLPDGKDKSLLFYPHPTERYCPVEPIQDYRITVDRTLNKLAKEKHGALYEQLRVTWGLLSADVQVAPLLIDLNDQTTWHNWIQRQRNIKPQSRLDDTIKALDEIIFNAELPYKVERVPPTTTHHGGHFDWSLIERLRNRGRLENTQEIKEIRDDI